MTTLALAALYAFIAGLYVGEWRTQRRNRHAVAAHDSILRSAKQAMQMQRFIGRGPQVTNVSEWALGHHLFRITVEPIEDNEKEHTTNAGTR